MNTKDLRARGLITQQRREGIDYLLWALEFYSDREIVHAIEKQGFRWAENISAWVLQPTLPCFEFQRPHND